MAHAIGSLMVIVFDSLGGQGPCEIVSVIAFTALLIPSLVRFTIFMTEHRRPISRDEFINENDTATVAPVAQLVSA